MACVLFVNDTESVTATRIEKVSGDVTMLTLSPGERAGVRASVNSYSTKNVEGTVKMAPDDGRPED